MNLGKKRGVKESCVKRENLRAFLQFQLILMQMLLLIFAIPLICRWTNESDVFALFNY